MTESEFEYETINRLQRENAELSKRVAELKQEQEQDTIRISEQTNRAVTAEWKLAAAEAALKLARPEIDYKRTHGQTTQARKAARRAMDAVDAAIDAAKTGVKA